MKMDDSLHFEVSGASSAYSGTDPSVKSTVSKPQQRKLTVDQATKIEREQKQSNTYSHRPSKIVVIIKWVSTWIFGVLLLAFVVGIKVSIVALSQHLNTTTDKKTACELFVMLFLITFVPNFINFFRGVWAGSFRKDIPWPKKTALAAGFVVSLSESFGICLFVFKLSAICKPYQVILLMNCVLLCPIISNLKSACGTRLIGWKQPAALFFQVVGIVLVTILLLVNDKMNDIKPDHIMIPVAVLCLSVAWMPHVQKFLLKTEVKPEPKQDDLTEDKNNTEQASFIETTQSTSVGYQSISESQNVETISIPITENPSSGHEPPTTSTNTSGMNERSTWKLTIYMSFLKMVFTLVFAIIFFKFWNKFDVTMVDFANGWIWTEVVRKGHYYFGHNIVASIMGYVVGYIMCTTCMKGWASTVPLLIATPLSLLLLVIDKSCDGLLISVDANVCGVTGDSALPVLIGAAIVFVLAHVLSVGWLLLQSQYIVMLTEEQLFWTPMYNPVLLDQWLTLVRRTEYNDEYHEDPVVKAKQSRIFICTTMYRELEKEMKQLLESIQGINLAQSEGHRHFEAHIFFDGAVKDRNPTEFVLQLVTLVESTLDVKAQSTTKTITPYGMSLAWKLNADPGKNGIPFMIHMKDNFKVKNKKRWSQVMYMSYVLDFLMPMQAGHATDENTYIMTTDADVKFTPYSVEALLDLMSRDPKVGAVCARTHPLGSGPMVWYQVFEYAIGHWFQKAAEHVIGSVLCSPGCFSVYRCKAIRDILPEYATNVGNAFDFLTKDMGEDRWFCTLMVQSGWRIEYCAASENETYCPEDFDEFFKQRRRWVASTLANLMLLLEKWFLIKKLNHRVSFVYRIYQAILLFATLIGPSSVILVVAGGLAYSWDVGSVTSIVIQVLVCIGFTFVCLFTSSDTQLTVAKILTFLYSAVMTAVLVGIAVQIVSDFVPPKPGAPPAENTTTPATTRRPSAISEDITISTTTLYLGTMTALYLVTGALHFNEFGYLVHGIWYLLCLPSGYLILMIYSICNITDRSWGTREVKTKSVITRGSSWQDTLKKTFMDIFFCCFKPTADTKTTSIQMEVLNSHKPRPISRSTSLCESPEFVSQNGEYDKLYRSMSEENRYIGKDGPSLSALTEDFLRTPQQMDEDEYEDIDGDTVKDVADWLPADLKVYAKNFIDNGFENTIFISAMTEKELKDIGIKQKGKKQFLMEAIKQLPDYEIQADVPENVEKWLAEIGLSQYSKAFRKEHINTSKDMEVLKSFGRIEIEKELKITKIGHIKRLQYAIQKLRNPTQAERKILEVKKALDMAKTHTLKQVNVEEYDFWDNLKQRCLLPQSTAYGQEDNLKSKLCDLRNSWLMILAVSNTLWLIVITTLANKGELLSVIGSNPLGLVVIVIFSFVMVIQFLAMIVHRVGTLIHYLTRAPYKWGDSFNTSWSFNDGDMRHTQSEDDLIAEKEKSEANKKIKQRIEVGYRGKKKEETQPLLQNQYPI